MDNQESYDQAPDPEVERIRELVTKYADKPKLVTIYVYTGGGSYTRYQDCVIGSALTPELTFTDQNGKQKITTCPYIIEEQ
jgi:hypothetical protein